ncbi:MAG: DUF481 domain-containing protein [Microscillaceae bacterium]|jgi:hypothetical protein|nr:DUF481 domain-containing protein [Microscillaceae bacterium]
MKKILYFGLLVLTQVVNAQINESDTLLLQTRVALTGNWQTGNVEMLVFRGRWDLSLAPSPRFAFKTQNAYLYQEFFRRKADEDIFSRNFVYYNPTRRIYPFAYTFLITNFRRKIDFRYFAGLGLGLHILRKPNHLLKTVVSGVYEHTRFNLNIFNEGEYNGSFQINTWRMTAWLFGRHFFAKRKVFLHYEAYIQPSVEKVNNFRWQTEIGVDIPVWRGLNFTSNFIYTFESVVVTQAKSDDSILTFGLAYQFKK